VRGLLRIEHGFGKWGGTSQHLNNKIMLLNVLIGTGAQNLVYNSLSANFSVIKSFSFI
jgi:hypothetical protein